MKLPTEVGTEPGYFTQNPYNITSLIEWIIFLLRKHDFCFVADNEYTSGEIRLCCDFFMTVSFTQVKKKKGHHLLLSRAVLCS